MSLSSRAAELEGLANSAELGEAHQGLALAMEKLDYVHQHARGIIGELPAAEQIGEIVGTVKRGIEQQGIGIDQVRRTIIDTASRVRSAGS
jgi:hypothetical protein